MHTPSYRHTIEGVDGKIHAYYGCSITGFFEFEEVLAHLERHAAEFGRQQTLEELYRSDSRFSSLVDRALTLNGIQASWLRWAQVQDLLFFRVEGDELRLPTLIEINRPQRAQPKGRPGQAATLPELIAGLTGVCDGLEEALRIAKKEPMTLVLDTLGALADQRQEATSFSDPTKSKAFKDWRQRERETEHGRQSAGSTPN